MIDELLRLSECDGVLEEPGFSRRPIHWFIDLDEQGNFLGLSPTVAHTISRKNGSLQEEIGKEYSRPAFFFMKIDKNADVIAAAGGGVAVAELGVGSLVEIFGAAVEAAKGQVPSAKPLLGKDRYKHDQFVELHKKLADANPSVRRLDAVKRFLSGSPHFPTEAGDLNLKRMAKQEFSFRVTGRPLINDPAIRRVWKEAYAAQRNNVAAKLPVGNGLFAGTASNSEKHVITPVFPHISGVPGGGGWCPLNSFDKAPSQSYGMGSLTVAMRLDVAERAAAALNFLLRDPSSHLQLGDTVAVFWAVPVDPRKKCLADVGFAAALATPDTLEVRDFLHGVWGQGIACTPWEDRFYCALLSSPQSRITVRSWHTDTLPAVHKHVRQWMKAAGVYRLSWDSAARQLDKSDFSPVSIMQLAEATVRRSRETKPTKPTKSTYTELFTSAMQGNPLSHKLFTATLQRQSLELAAGCDKKDRETFEQRLRARTALIQLYMTTNGKGDSMVDNHDVELNAGYLCGRLLAILDKIHIEAHKESGGTISSPANRSYAAASTTPAMIFPQLCSLARVHLNKIGGGWAWTLENGYPDQGFEALAGVCAKLRFSAGNQFPRTLSLDDQGRFAIGFYYERTRQWPKQECEKEQ